MLRVDLLGACFVDGRGVGLDGVLSESGWREQCGTPSQQAGRGVGWGADVVGMGTEGQHHGEHWEAVGRGGGGGLVSPCHCCATRGTWAIGGDGVYKR